MYEAHYDLKAKPFQITTDPKFLWLGEKHSEALATLKYGILENKGFLLLTGDVGTGKTALINRLVKMIDIAAIVATVPDPGLDSLDFFNFLSVELNMKKKFNSKGAFLIDLKQFLLKAYAEQKKVLLVIDEAQRLNNELLEQIRLLSNIEMENRKLINIFFVGQSEFNDTLMQNGNRAVRQRITVSYHIEPLTEVESQQYIQHRLKVAGAVREIFSPDAIREIFAFSRGYPRLINIICDHALLTGYASGKKTININVIKECEQELQIPINTQSKIKIENADEEAQKTMVPPALAQKPSFGKKAGVIAALTIAAGLAVYFLSYTDFLNFGESPPWSIQELAPQEFQGPLSQETEAVENPQSEINAIKEVPPIEETSLNERAVAKEEVLSDTPVALPIPDRKTLVYFKHNSNELQDQYFEALDRIAAFMLQSPTTKASIRGFTDSTGNSSYNISVSQFRANIIKTYLVGKGVDPSNIDTVGLGSENPIASNATEEGRQKNRRVEIELNPG